MRIKAKFENVSNAQWLWDMNESFGFGDIDEEKTLSFMPYLPKRSTAKSGGYDFYSPYDIELKPGESEVIPTGIRVFMPDDYILAIFPRSGLGFKYKARLNNTVGILDADYVNSDNEGHIFIKISNEGNKPLSISEGQAFAQGIFLQYGITEDDDCEGVRNGGFGSTDGK